MGEVRISYQNTIHHPKQRPKCHTPSTHGYICMYIHMYAKHARLDPNFEGILKLFKAKTKLFAYNILLNT